MGLNGFIFKKINENLNIETEKNPGSRLEVACLTAQPTQPNFGGNGLDWLC